jgi:hypothetical protein
MTQGIAVFELALQDVTEDLHIAVRVSTKARPRGDAVLVDDPQGTEPHVPGIVIAGEGKGVAGVKPAMIGGTTMGSETNLSHERDSRVGRENHRN